jgi:hypothetical protein
MKNSCFYILTLNGVLVGDTVRAPFSIVVEDVVDALLRIVVGDDMDTLDDNLGSGDGEGVLFGFSTLSLSSLTKYLL